MYTDRNFKTKKALKQAVALWNEYVANPAAWTIKYAAPMSIGAVAGLAPKPPQPIGYYQPGPFGGNEPRDGSITLEGPHYPAAHSWYAQATVKDGRIVKVK